MRAGIPIPQSGQWPAKAAGRVESLWRGCVCGDTATEMDFVGARGRQKRVGILKMTFALFLLIGIERGVFAVLGGVAIAVLMGAAVFTHVRVKNPVFKMLPSSTLLMLSALVAWLNYQLLAG